MKKTSYIVSVSLLILLLAGGAFAVQSSWHYDQTFYSLSNTKWTGDLTVVEPAGTTSALTGVILTFTMDANGFVSGTISDPALSFSGVRGDFEQSLDLTAINYKIRAEVRRNFRHTWSYSTPDSMWIQGSNYSDGSTFVGTLLRQTP
jgi:hypothetical protein